MVVACDLPGLDVTSVRSVIDGLDGHDLASAHTDGPLPLCAVWSTATLSHLEDRFAAGERAVQRVAVGLDRFEVEIDGDRLRNVNTPADLDVVRRAMDQGGAGPDR